MNKEVEKIISRYTTDWSFTEGGEAEAIKQLTNLITKEKEESFIEGIREKIKNEGGGLVLMSEEQLAKEKREAVEGFVKKIKWYRYPEASFFEYNGEHCEDLDEVLEQYLKEIE